MIACVAATLMVLPMTVFAAKDPAAIATAVAEVSCIKEILSADK